MNSATFEYGADARAISIGPPVASCDSGSKSLIGSYGSFGCRIALLMWVSGSVIITVCPSGAAFATASAASVPLAPGFASTTIDWPQRAFSFSP
jgi:hypothetical protein